MPRDANGGKGMREAMQLQRGRAGCNRNGALFIALYLHSRWVTCDFSRPSRSSCLRVLPWFESAAERALKGSEKEKERNREKERERGGKDKGESNEIRCH